MKSMKTLSLYGAILFSGFVFFTISSSPVAHGERIAPLTVEFHETESVGNIIKKGIETPIGELVLTAGDETIELKRILLDVHGALDVQEVRRAWVLNERGQKLTSSARIQDDIVIFDYFTSRFTMEPGETRTLTIVLEISLSTDAGNEVQFEIPKDNYIDIAGPTRYETEVIADFPFITKKYVILDAEADSVFRIQEDEEFKTAVSGSIKRGVSDYPFARLSLDVFGEGNIRIDQLVFQKTGNAGFDDVSNIRLMKENGEFIGGIGKKEGDKVIFSEPFTVITPSEEKMTMVMDIEETAKPGTTLGFEIYTRSSLQFSSVSEGKIASVAARFPIRIGAKIIEDPGLEIATSDTDIPPDSANSGSTSVLFGSWIISGGVEDVTIERMTFQKNGDLPGEKIRHLLMIDGETGEELCEGSLSSNELLFSCPLQVRSGVQMNINVIGDISDDAENGTTLNFILEKSGITAVSREGDVVPVDGNFPVKTPVMRVGAVGNRSSLTVELLPYESSVREIFPFIQDTVFGRMQMKADGDDIEVRKIKIAFSGMEAMNFRLMDAFGKIIAGPSEISNGELVFSDAFGIRDGSTQELLLVGDTGDTHETASALRMEMDVPADIEAQGIGPNFERAEVSGLFPMSLAQLRTAPTHASEYLSVFLDLFPVGKFRRGESDVLLGKIYVQANGKDMSIERMLLKPSGDIGNTIENLRMKNEEGLVIDDERDPANDIIVFEEEISFLDGEEKVFTLIADIKENAPNDAMGGFEIASPEYFVVSTFPQEDIEVVSNFPLRTPLFQIHEYGSSACSGGTGHYCGIQYESCEETPCQPKMVDYENICTLESDGAFLIAESTCSNIQDPQYPEDPGEGIFPDIDLDTPEGVAALDLYERGIIGGYPDGEFKGHLPVNRAELAKFLLSARFEEIPLPQGANPFPDVENGSWYEPYVLTAYDLGIIGGYPDGYFRPEDTVNTAEFLKMISMTFSLAEGYGDSFSDVSESDWFSPFTGAAEEYDFFPARGSFLEPGRELTRYEVAVAISNYLSKNGE